MFTKLPYQVFIKNRIILTPDLSSTKESLGGTQSSPQGSESKYVRI